MAEWEGQRAKRWLRRRALPLVYVGLGLIAIGLAVLWVVAPVFYDNVNPHAQATATATTRAGILAVFAATVAVLGATVALAETRRASREADQRERYSKAIDQLGTSGSDKADVRLGGIYSLQRIAEDSDRDLPTVVDVLCAFVRGHGQGPEDDSYETLKTHRLPADVQAALSVVGRIHNVPADAIPVTASGNGSYIDLREAHLECANLYRANLTGADLGGAKLTGANLNEATLTYVVLQGADLAAASLFSANLKPSVLHAANLTGADLTNADLSDAYGLTQDQLDATRGNEYTRLPEGLVRPEHWIR